MGKCVMGFDFGTLSCRGVSIDIEDGHLIATAESSYKHGVISDELYINHVKLKSNWFLQDPQDWINSMQEVSLSMLKNGGIDPEEVLGIGTDFTSCTVVPTMSDGTALCELKEYAGRPNAWPKLWKHHGAEEYAKEIETYARKNTTWLKRYYGNLVSSEWVYPKVLQVLREDSDIYEYADLFMEAVDWIVLKLTGVPTRNTGVLGVNAFWIKGKGYPDNGFNIGIDQRFEDLIEKKFRGQEVCVGECVGHITQNMAKALGITTKAIVASGHGDSAVTAAGAGVNKSGDLLLVMGTSTCHQLLYEKLVECKGFSTISADGMLPGLYSYESGQPATGDVFDWFVRNCISKEYIDEATSENKSIIEYITDKASRLKPGESGMIGLDWYNGNRGVLANYNLSGMLLGMTLRTKPEEIYHTLVEANLYGSRKIIDTYIESGIRINKVYAVGGIPRKSPFMMQLCADILNRDIHVLLSDNISARGSAICAAVAVGKQYKTVGYHNFEDAMSNLISDKEIIYHPNMCDALVYDRIFSIYKKIHNLFGLDDSIMKQLRSIHP